jgi:hypothetical protein
LLACLECVDAPQHEQSPLGSRQTNIESPSVGKETDIPARIIPNGGENDNLLFPPFITINRLDVNVSNLHSPAVSQNCFEPFLMADIRVEKAIYKGHLSNIWCNDPNVSPVKMLDGE